MYTCIVLNIYSKVSLALIYWNLFNLSMNEALKPTKKGQKETIVFTLELQHHKDSTVGLVRSLKLSPVQRE